MVVGFSTLLVGCSRGVETAPIRVCYDVTVPFFYSEDGVAVGVEHDLLLGFAESLGRTIEALEIEHFEDVLPAVEAGQCDVAAATVTSLPERAARYDLSVPYFPVRVVMVSPQSAPIDGLAALEGRRVASLAGARYDQLLTGVENLERIAAQSGREQFELLASGAVDALVYDSAIVLFLLEDFPQMAISGALSEIEHYAFVMPKDSPMRSALDRYLKDTRVDGTYERVLTRYFGAENAREILASSVASASDDPDA